MRIVVAVAALGVLMAPASRGQLSGRERREAEKMVKGKLYLRINLPCRFGVGRYGSGVQPLVEVSPTMVDTERLMDTGAPGYDTIYWGFGPNDPVRYPSLDFKQDRVRVWMEGVPPRDHELMVDFIHIKTLEDFKKAFDLTFSRVPLQDEHPDWPVEVRQAIGDRRVIKGMTKRQAYCVVGTPLNIHKAEQGGVEVETWFPRQDLGSASRGGAWGFRGATGVTKTETSRFPKSLKFVSGVLEEIEAASAPTKLELGK